MIDEQPDEGFHVHSCGRIALIGIYRKLDLVLHVLHLLLGGIVSHGSHEVGQLCKWHRAIQLPRLGCALVLASNHGVVEEVFHVLVNLSKHESEYNKFAI